MNMSYCRFYNTSIDLDSCLNTIEELDLKDLSSFERQALIKLLTTQYLRLAEIVNDIECQYQEDISEEIVNKWLEEI